MVRVLFVCLGNICRSPTAEGVFRKLVLESGLQEHIEIDSAGTHAYHIGKPPDARAQSAARQRGVDLSALRGRQAMPVDFERFDYILAMDSENLEHLLEICPVHYAPKVRLFMEYAPHWPPEVPDPYFGGAAGFDRVLDMIEQAAAGLLESIRRERL
ncbi:MAG: low molecular weight phosphotyrosine protein phosphatase [Pseudomonadota bacterium]|nr:MAG: low molecular weight phosphotyrosine protein phosphatase [Pseudomonadota bacterium]